MKLIKQFLLPVIILSISFILILIFIVPSISRTSRLRQQLKEQKEAQSKLSQKIASLSNIDELTQNTAVNISLQAVPMTIPFQKTLALLEQLSQRNSIAIRELSVTDTNSGLTLNYIAIGTEENIQNFFLDLDRSLPLSDINYLTMTKAGSQEASLSAQYYSTELEFVSHWQPALSSVGKPSDPLPVISDVQKNIIENLRSFETFSAITEDNLSDISPDRTQNLFPE